MQDNYYIRKKGENEKREDRGGAIFEIKERERERASGRDMEYRKEEGSFQVFLCVSEVLIDFQRV
jgi:hypothetical protein